MKEPTFDIFSGVPDDGDCWVEAVEGLANARQRMGVIAAQNPGKYFLFSSGSQSVLAHTETFKKPASRTIVSNQTSHG
jgi:hypothetical protein